MPDGVAVSSVSIPSQWLIEIFGAGGASTANIEVTPRSAMRCTAVRCAVQVIAEAMGQLPLDVYRRASDGTKSAVEDHSVAALFNVAANDWTAGPQFREQLTRDALLWGNGFGFINRMNGKPVELVRLDPETATSVQLDQTTGEPLYRVGGHFIPRADIIHIQAPSINGLSGESPVMLAREAIGLAMVMEQHAARLFSRGGRPSGVLEFPNRLGGDTVKRISESWHAAHAGENSGRTAILEEGGKFSPLALNSVDSQFLELRKFAIDEIARAFRVPPHMLMELGRATWANSEQMGAEFIALSLMRWIKAWEGEIGLKLFAPADRAHLRAEFDLDDFLRPDLAARATAYSQLIAARVLSPNEAREEENRAPYVGGERFENPNTAASGATPNA